MGVTLLTKNEMQLKRTTNYNTCKTDGLAKLLQYGVFRNFKASTEFLRLENITASQCMSAIQHTALHHTTVTITAFYK